MYKIEIIKAHGKISAGVRENVKEGIKDKINKKNKNIFDKGCILIFIENSQSLS